MRSVPLLLVATITLAALASAVPPGGAVTQCNVYGCLDSGCATGGASCRLTSCDAAGRCDVGVRQTQRCRLNASIEGETCALAHQADAGARADALPVGTTQVVGSVVLANGSVDAKDLPNSWESNGAEASALAGGIDLGTTYVYTYNSTVQGAHAYQQRGAQAGHSGPDGSQAILVGVVTSERGPAGCFVRGAGIVEESIDCPPTEPLMP